MMRNAECGMRNAEWALRNAKRGMRNAEWAWRTPAALLLALGLGPSGLSSQTSLSIYKDGRVVVRQSLAQPLQKGRNAITLKIEGLDPATLFSPDSEVSVIAATWHPASTREDALARAVGRTLSFVRGKGDTVQATVLRVAPLQYRLADGRLWLTGAGDSQPSLGVPLFPAEASLVQTSPEVAITLEASQARPRTDLAYVSQGVSWEATYQAVLVGDRALVAGTATITSQSFKADSADLQLVAGSVSKTRMGNPPIQLQEGVVAGVAARARRDYTEEQAVGETHVYTLPGRLSLEPGVPMATALFPRGSAQVTRDLIVRGVLPWQGWLPQTPAEPNRVPVEVWYTMKRARGTPFGDRPLPAGTVQLYQADSAGRLQLIGEATNDHTAPGRDLRVQSGDAFDVTAERVQTDYNQERLPAPSRDMPARSRLTASYRVTVTNAKAEALTVDVRESRFGVWRITASSVPPEKLSATEQRFRLSVPANGSATLTYTVQIES